MFDMMKKLQEAQKQMKQIKERLDTISVTGSSPEGKIEATATGNRRVTDIKILDESLLNDKEQLEDYLVMALNDVLSKAETVNESEMKAAAGSMMPGLGGMFK